MRKTKRKLGVHHRIHRHIKKHLSRLKKKRPHVHKALVLLSITLPVVLGALLFGSSALYYYESFLDNTDYSKEKISVDITAVPDDTVNWKTYQDDETKFSVKYPDRWDDPEIITGKSGVKYLRKISFDNGLENDSKSYKGFEIFIYDSEKYPNPSKSDNLIPRDTGTFEANNCDKAEFSEAVIGEEGYPAQEIDISSGDKCFQEAYFFSINRGKYTYNIVPKIGKVDNPIAEGLKPDVISAFPKFFELTSTLLLSKEEKKVVEETPAEKQAVKKTPPRRVLKPLGRCKHKNDKPRKSKTKKHRHMDEDCCMDPDEWPNPRCQY